MVQRASSVSGLRLSSAPIKSDKIFFTSREDTSSPLSVLKDSEKKNFSGNVPKGVVTYLLLATRDTVEISKPTFSAISFKIIGFNLVSSPVKKYSLCC